MYKFYRKNYYRPQFVRDNYIDLCGEWNFVFDDNDVGLKSGYHAVFPVGRKICVPFSPETAASGIKDERYHRVVWYSRSLSGITIAENERLILHFEGADYLSKVWLNGVLVGTHRGGYTRFSVDVTEQVKDGENILTVRCEDDFDQSQPRGKQRWKNESYACWYVQTTGIWKPVWAEKVNVCRLDSVKITPEVDEMCVRFDFNVTDTENVGVETNVWLKNKKIISSIITTDSKRFGVLFDLHNDLALWSPDSPALYDVEFVIRKNGIETDRVGSYFGMRSIRAENGRITLNNSPLYQKLLLSQNYWLETGLTLPDESAGIKDIEIATDAGFNGLRIHQKIEDERFLMLCDVKGLLVWGEFPATYEFSDDAVENFTYEWTSAVRQQYNHPCIITWVPFNESWGVSFITNDKNQQFFTESVYALTKTLDKTRPVISNDGYEHTRSDIITLHDYDGDSSVLVERYGKKLGNILLNKECHGGVRYAFAEGYGYSGQPIMVTEYGGIALSGSEGWGYNDKAANEEEFIARYDALTSAIQQVPDVCGYCYTQISDVYQEENGLTDAHRKPKIDLSRIKKINDRRKR
ncbi:MAG: glycoside hydrolase family 2 [Clostridia bacterium]|nr:glycoside hydrolase family 2 [Clostridia bacterium]